MILFIRKGAFKDPFYKASKDSSKKTPLKKRTSKEICYEMCERIPFKKHGTTEVPIFTIPLEIMKGSILLQNI